MRMETNFMTWVNCAECWLSCEVWCGQYRISTAHANMEIIELSLNQHCCKTKLIRVFSKEKGRLVHSVWGPRRLMTDTIFLNQQCTDSRLPSWQCGFTSPSPTTYQNKVDKWCQPWGNFFNKLVRKEIPTFTWNYVIFSLQFLSIH